MVERLTAVAELFSPERIAIGLETGQETAVGAGEVDWPAFFSTLKEVNFAGTFVIEREAGSQRVSDIRRAPRIVIARDSVTALEICEAEESRVSDPVRSGISIGAAKRISRG